MSLNGSLSKSTGLSGSLSGSYNYEQFTNKPKINGVELTGNKSFEDLGLPKQVQADYTQNDETQPDYIKNRPLVALSTLVTEETSDISANIDLKGVLTYRYQTIHIYNDTSYNMVQFLYGGKVIDHVSADGYSYIYVEKYTDIENLLFDIKFYGFDIKCEVADGELNVVTDIATNNNEVLLRDNKEEYIPTTDYSPATKRYVDDSVDKLKEGLAEKVPKTDYAPEPKSDIMTQPVGKDSEGKLWTIPGSGGSGIAVTGATVGQTVKIAAVDNNGVPTAWEAVDLPSGVGSYKHIETITIPDDEEIAVITFTIPAKTRKLYVLGRTNTISTFDTTVRPYVKNGNKVLAVLNLNLSMSHRKVLFAAELYDNIQFMSFSSSNSDFTAAYPGAESFYDYASYFYAENNTFNIIIQSESSNKYFVPGCTFELYALCEE